MASLRVCLCVGVLVSMFMLARAEKFQKAAEKGEHFENPRLKRKATMEDRLRLLKQRRDGGQISDEHYNKLLSHLKNMEGQQLMSQR